MDNDIFKALSDPSRRKLLDLLYESDGRTLGELCTYLQMSRFGVMKHLNLLEEAGLITTRKIGRKKLHYLNPVPIRQVYDRWVSKYAEPWVSSMNFIKSSLESEVWMEKKPEHVYQILIKTTPEQLWQAITDPKMTIQFLYQSRIDSEWKEGAEYTFKNQDGEITAKGTIVELNPPHRLVYTWTLLAVRETSGDEPSRITWEIREHEDKPGICILTVTHDQFDGAPNTYQFVQNGWPAVLSELKTLLETGETFA